MVFGTPTFFRVKYELGRGDNKCKISMRAPNRSYEVVQPLRLEFCVWWNLGSECVWHALLEPLAGSEHCSPPCQVLIAKIKDNCFLSTQRCCLKVWLVLGASIKRFEMEYGIKYHSWWTVILKLKKRPAMSCAFHLYINIWEIRPYFTWTNPCTKENDLFLHVEL